MNTVYNIPENADSLTVLHAGIRPHFITFHHASVNTDLASLSRFPSMLVLMFHPHATLYPLRCLLTQQGRFAPPILVYLRGNNPAVR